MIDWEKAKDKSYTEYLREEGYLDECIRHYRRYTDLLEQIKKIRADGREIGDDIGTSMECEYALAFRPLDQYSVLHGSMTVEEAKADFVKYAEGSRPEPLPAGSDPDGSEA